MNFAQMVLDKLNAHGSTLSARAVAASISKDETIVSAVLEALELGGLVEAYNFGDGVTAYELTNSGFALWEGFSGR